VRNRERSIRAACLCALAGVTLLAAAPALAVGPSEDPDLQSFAAKSYAERYGVSLEDARLRLEIQDRAAQLSEKLEPKLGSAFGGVWLTGGSRDVIKVGIARSASQSAETSAVAQVPIQAAQEGVAEDTSAVGVASSVEELENAQAALDLRLRSLLLANKARTSLDPSASSLTIEVASALTDAERADVQSAIALSPVQLRVSDAGTPILTGGGDACDYPFCDRPLRGGVRIGAAGRCTAGFNARGRNVGRAYVLTAGHCLDDDGGTWFTRNSVGDLHAIGARQSWNFPGRDAGIIRVADTSFWQDPPPAPRVFVDSGPNTTVDDNYEITAETTSDVGEFVCRTSGFSFTTGEDYTRCGTVTALNVTAELEPGQTASGLVQTDVCRLQGSSGGPVYKTRLAYGTHSGGDDAPCKSWYTPATAAENAMNVDIIHP